jgi:helix-turn-helix protein
MTSQARSFPSSASRQTADDAPDTGAVETPYLNHSEAAVLVTLAAMTDDGGIVQWPGPTDIARRTGLSVAIVCNAIKTLIKKRVIVPHATHPAHKTYRAFRIRSFNVPPGPATPIECTHPERLVFHFLADHADDSHTVRWPNYHKVAHLTGLSPLAVKRGLDTLISNNVIAPDEIKRGQKTIYVLRLKALSAEACNA